MSCSSWIAVAAMAATVHVAAAAQAGAPEATGRSFPAEPDADAGPVEEIMVEPLGADPTGADPPELTPERYWTLQRVNAAVNGRIRPVGDPGVDLWILSPGLGGCEEYVLMKREMLAQLGWPRSALGVAVVVDDEGAQYHAVLLVSTKAGDFVLDNLNPQVLRVGETDYHFLAAKSTKRLGAWSRVRF